MWDSQDYCASIRCVSSRRLACYRIGTVWTGCLVGSQVVSRGSVYRFMRTIAVVPLSAGHVALSLLLALPLSAAPLTVAPLTTALTRASFRAAERCLGDMAPSSWECLHLGFHFSSSPPFVAAPSIARIPSGPGQGQIGRGDDSGRHHLSLPVWDQATAASSTAAAADGAA